MQGVRAGATYEHLRLALSAPTEVCDACSGYGRARQDRHPGAELATDCAKCDGTGVMQASRPVLYLAAD
jgi:DnaJ-class molecular chaperone